MKSEGSDDALNKVLSEWRLNTPLPPRFQESVWRRIETAEAPHVTLWNLAAQWVGIVLPRPAMAVSYVAILLALGISVGWVQARQQTAQVKSQLGQRYIQILDPYIAPRP